VRFTCDIFYLFFGWIIKNGIGILKCFKICAVATGKFLLTYCQRWHWRWRHCTPSKCRYLCTSRHGLKFRKTRIMTNMPFSCCVTKATGALSESIILISFPRLKWLSERASLSRLHAHCLSFLWRWERLLLIIEYIFCSTFFCLYNVDWYNPP